VSDFDERDPFPEASVPAPDSEASAPDAPAAPDPGAQATAEHEAAAALAGAPEPSTATTTAPRAEPLLLAVPPSEAPTLPLIPVERLRFTADAADAADAPDARDAPDAPLGEIAAGSRPAPAAASPAPPPAAPPRPQGPASGERAAEPRVPIAAQPVRDLSDRRQPLYRECQGYRLRLDPPDLARLRELPGSRGKSDDEIGEAFFDGQADRLAASIAGDVPTPSEIRVVVDPYSRQAFLALENRIRGILSF
jgi:hypothetical protein